MGFWAALLARWRFDYPDYPLGDEAVVPWCDEFVPWSCHGILDEGMDACDECGLPKARHPVMTEHEEIVYHGCR